MTTTKAKHPHPEHRPLTKEGDREHWRCSLWMESVAAWQLLQLLKTDENDLAIDAIACPLWKAIEALRKDDGR